MGPTEQPLINFKPRLNEKPEVLPTKRRADLKGKRGRRILQRRNLVFQINISLLPFQLPF